TQKPWLDLIRRGDTLPGHRHTELESPHKFLGQRHVTREKSPNAGSAGSIQNLTNMISDLLSIFNLFHDSNLHVIDDQGQACRVAYVFQCLRNIQSECPLHYFFTSTSYEAHFTLRRGVRV